MRQGDRGGIITSAPAGRVTPDSYFSSFSYFSYFSYFSCSSSCSWQYIEIIAWHLLSLLSNGVVQAMFYIMALLL